MVASDTVVGLVGAGILLVALVGVFVYESQQGAGGAADLETEDYATKGSGTIQLNPGSGTPGPGGVCQAPVCTGASTNVQASFEGLPSPGQLKYVAYLTGGSSPYKVGALSASGNKYQITSNTPTSNGDKTSFVVSLEKGDGGASPGFPIFSFAVKSGSTSVPGTVEENFIGEGGDHTLRFTPQGGQVNVSVAIKDVTELKPDFVFRAWLETENATGKSFTFVGNFTPDHMDEMDMAEHGHGTMNYTLAANVPGARNDYNELFITIESKSGTIGDQLGGPAVIVSRFNEFASAAPIP